MGAMKEIYTETQDLYSAANELNEDQFIDYTERMGWVSSTEMEARRRNFETKVAAPLMLAYLGDPEVKHPSSSALGQILEAGREMLGIDSDGFYARMMQKMMSDAPFTVFNQSEAEKVASGE